MDRDPVRQAHTHIDGLATTLTALHSHCEQLAHWGSELVERLSSGHRLLAAGNGGSAAEAQHLTAELVGRFHDDRPPFAALALHTDTSTLTAISNDYGYPHAYARQVHAHAQPRDVLILLSTSGRSPNLLHAAAAGHSTGATVWALTGPAPNPLADAVEDAISLPGDPTSVQEAHLVAIHTLCEAFEAALARTTRIRRAS